MRRERLVEQGWRMFLVRVHNVASSVDSISFANALETPARIRPDLGSSAQRPHSIGGLNMAPLVKKMWILSQLHDATPLVRQGTEIPVTALSGIPIEYRIVQL